MPNVSKAARAREAYRIAPAQGRARDDVHGAAGKLEMRRSRVGGEIDDGTALQQRFCQRLRREQVSAGSAGGEQHQRRRGHQAVLPSLARSRAVSMAVRGCSRVSASSMPMA